MVIPLFFDNLYAFERLFRATYGEFAYKHMYKFLPIIKKKYFENQPLILSPFLANRTTQLATHQNPISRSKSPIQLRKNNR